MSNVAIDTPLHSQMMLREPRNQKVRKRVVGPKTTANSIGGFGASEGSSSGSISSAGDLMTLFFLGVSGSGAFFAGAGAAALFAGSADSAESGLLFLATGRAVFLFPPTAATPPPSALTASWFFVAYWMASSSSSSKETLPVVWSILALISPLE